MQIKINDIVNEAKKAKQKTIAVAGANDLPVLIAAVNAKKDGIIKNGIFTGNKQEILEMAKENSLDIDGFEIVDCSTDAQAAKEAVKACLDNKAQVLVKGFLDTSVLLKACVDKETGIRIKGRRFSSAGYMEIPGYERGLFITDPTTNPLPDLETKKSMIENAVVLANAMGVEMPKVALLSAKEKPDPSLPSTLEARELQKMNKRGEITDCIVVGPISLDIAISPMSAEHKGFKGEIMGDADILVFPNLETANITYKALDYFAHAVSIGVILGAKVPIVATSRSDLEETRLRYIAAASLIADKLGL